MEILSRVGLGSDEPSENESQRGDPNASYPSVDREVTPAYDMTREQKFEFPETATIEPVDEEFVRITVETITTSVSFNARITGFTSRFGELDVEYISVGGYSVSLYHDIPERDEYFVRKLFYYEDSSGVGSEKTSEGWNEPMNPDWVRSEDFGETVVTDGSGSYLTVYDWREEMLTHNKPTPSRGGEVVFQYRDSPNSGGNRSGSEFILQLKEIRTVTGERLTTNFVTVDESAGELVAYAEAIGGGVSYTARVPLSRESLSIADVNWERRSDTSLPSPSWFDNVVWVRLPKHTWDVRGFERESCVTRVEEGDESMDS